MSILEDIQRAIKAIENEPPRPRCEHIVPYSYVRNMRAAGHTVVVCPRCGQTVRLG